MLKRIGAAAALLLVIHSGAVAQTMRFTTNVGSFDMVLNPENDFHLQPIVDNIVAYIGLGRYHFSAVNRAHDEGPGTADDFVVQMGGFMASPPLPELWADLHTPVERLSDGVTVDANGDRQVDFNALSNTRGTVSLALGDFDHDNNPATDRVTNPNSGTSSFFINLGSNTFLDERGFVPFARIENMQTIDKIMQLMQTDLSQEVGQPGNLAYRDVPLTDNGRMVVVRDVEVIEADEDFSFVGPIATALELLNRNSQSAASLTASSADESILGEQSSAALLAEPGLAGAADISATTIPEPSTIALGLLGVFGALMAGRRRSR
jgi:cyclophilin family peptidyl-prolyl cis-trans isomerase